MTLTDAEIAANSLVIEAVNDIAAERALLRSRLGGVSVTSTSGALLAENIGITAGTRAGGATQENSVRLASGTGMELSDASIDGAAVTIETGGALTAEGLEAVALGALEATSAGNATITRANLSGTTVAVTASDVAADNAAIVTTAGDATLTATTGSVNAELVKITSAQGVDISGAGINLKDGVLGAAGNLTAEAVTGAIAADSASLTAGGTAELTASQGSVTFAGGELESKSTVRVTAGTGMTLESASVTAETGDLTLETAQGDLSASNAELSATAGEAHLDAESGLILAASASVTGDDVDLTAGADIAAEGLHAAAVDELTLKASGGMMLTQADLSAGSVAIEAQNDIRLGRASFRTSTGGVAVTSISGALLAENLGITAGTNAGGATQENSARLASGTGMQLSDASISGAAVAIETGGALAAEGLEAAALGALEATSAGSATFARAILSGTTVSVTANDIAAENATIGTTEGDATLRATAGSVNAETASVTSAQSVVISAKTDASLAGLVASSAAGMDIRAETGAIELDDAMLRSADVSASSAGTISAERADIETVGEKGQRYESAQAGIELGASQLTVGAGDLVVSGASDISAEALDVTVRSKSGTALKFASAAGSIDLANAVFKGDIETGGHIEALSISAETGDVNLRNVASTAAAEAGQAQKSGLSAGEISINAGGELALSGAAQTFEATSGDLNVSAGSLAGNKLAANTALKAAGDLSFAVSDALSIAEGFSAQAQSVNISSGQLDMAGDSVVRAAHQLAISAHDGASFSGDILLSSRDLVSVVSEAGGITLAGDVVVGDEDLGAATSVRLTAHGDIVQRDMTGKGGVRAQSLEAASAAGSILLDARSDAAAGHVGNIVSNAAFEAGSDIVFGVSGGDVTVAVNASKDGLVEGDLKLSAEEAGIRFTNDIRSTGDVLVNAAALHGSGLSADGAVEIVAALFDDSIEPGELSGVDCSGTVKGSSVIVFTNEGDITLGRVESETGFVDLYRLSTAQEGTVTVGGGVSADTATIFNGNGDIVFTGSFHGEDTVFAFTGAGGRTQGLVSVTSSKNRVGAFENAGQFGDFISLDKMLGSTAGDLRPGGLPHFAISGAGLDVTEEATRMEFVKPWSDFDSPTDRYFFLGLRIDAASSKVADESEERRKDALEAGLPASGEAVITDSRPKEPLDLSWLLVSLD